MHEAAMKAKIVDVLRSVLTITGIKLDGSAGVTFGSCADDHVKPSGAPVTT